MRSERLVLIGASHGGVEALKAIAARMPADFPSPILVVVHVGNRPSVLPQIIDKAGPLGASHAHHGEMLRPGHFHFAPPDHHMVVEDGRIALTRGPKEHHARPAVDPLFRSGALAYGSRVIALVLTGFGEDGTSGLRAVNACGGIALAQDPFEAETDGMPLSALRSGAAQRSVSIEEAAALLASLASEPAPAHRECPRAVMLEHALFLNRGDPMEHLRAIGKPSAFVCPECRGGLWEVGDSGPSRFRCHTGHAYTLRSLQHAQSEETDAALWAAMRGLQEEAALLSEMARASFQDGDPVEAARLEHAAAAVHGQARALRMLVERAPDEAVADSPRLRQRAG